MKFQFEYEGKINYVEVSQQHTYATLTIDGVQTIVTPSLMDNYKLSLYSDQSYLAAFRAAYNEANTKGL